MSRTSRMLFTIPYLLIACTNSKGKNPPPRLRMRQRQPSTQAQELRPFDLQHAREAEGAHLPKRVVVGLAREAADEDRAVGVAGGLGVAERVV